MELNSKLEENLSREEELQRQKSREIWLKEGDRNTKYFHSCTIHERKYNRIEKLKKEDGSWLSNREEIGNKLCRSLTTILTSSGVKDLNITKKVTCPIISDEAKENLISVPSEVKLKMRFFKWMPLNPQVLMAI